MTTYSIIVFREGAHPPDVSRGDIINVDAPWDLVEGLARLALARYPGADKAVAVDEMGITKGEWHGGQRQMTQKIILFVMFWLVVIGVTALLIPFPYPEVHRALQIVEAVFCGLLVAVLAFAYVNAWRLRRAKGP